MSVHFDKRGMSIFARALGDHYGVSVLVGVGDAFCTDGKTVRVPDMVARSTEEADSAAGSVAHEILHCLFGSVPDMHRFIAEHPESPALAQLAYNTAVDAMDEAYGGSLNHRLREIIAVKNQRCASLFVSEVLPSFASIDDPVRRAAIALSCGRILALELDPSLCKFLANASNLPPEISRVATRTAEIIDWMYQSDAILWGNSDGYGSGDALSEGVAFRRQLTPAVAKAAEGLLSLVKKLCPPDADSGQGDGSDPDAGQDTGQDAGPSGDNCAGSQDPSGKPETNPSGPELESRLQPGQGSSKFAPDIDAELRQRLNAIASSDPAKDDVPVDPTQEEAEVPEKVDDPDRISQIAITGSDPFAVGHFNRTLYEETHRHFTDLVRRLLESDRSDGIEPGFASGSRVCSPHRYATDFRCFGRREGEGERAAVALLIDQSGSMDIIADTTWPTDDADKSRLAVVSAICAAFSDAAFTAANCAMWAFETNTRRLSSPIWLRALEPNGFTATHAAVECARRWLRDQPEERKVLVVLTDGGPDCPGQTSGEVLKCTRSGIEVIVFAIAGCEDACRSTMPGAYVVGCHCDNPTRIINEFSDVLRYALRR